MDKKIDITSTAVEKGVDTAKGFLDKLIIPSLEETGLLIKDHITMWRFKNQVKMLVKSKAICEKHNINPKTISLKLVAPLLDYAGLEEDDDLHDKWAILLSNMVDSEQNIENHVFPYILSQLSKNEFMELEQAYDKKRIRVASLMQEADEFRSSRIKIEQKLRDKIEEAENKMQSNIEDSDEYNYALLLKFRLENELRQLPFKEEAIMSKIKEPEVLRYNCLKDFEFSNVIRLGIVKEQKDFYTDTQTLKIPPKPLRYSSYSDATDVSFKVNLESYVANILTELGELFFSACKEKTITK